MELMNRVKVWRAQADVTQEKLAHAIGVSRQTIHSVERGKFVPSVVIALKMARFFKTDVEHVFFLAGDEK